jgi:L-ribulose-5-phosphate 3-epimerase
MLRRDFLKMSGGFAMPAAFGVFANGSHLAIGADGVGPAAVPISDRICLFTDHLDDFGYSYADLAGMLKPLKISGPDLTVRAGGVVAPDQAVEELPKVAAAFREAGMTIPMISTNLTRAGDPTARPIFSSMQQLGIRYYKLGYYHYHDLAMWESELVSQRQDLAGLIDLGHKFQVQAGFHNHAGAGIGGALWDAWEFLRPLDPARVGFYFDPGHATIEGAKYSWKLNLQRISSRLTMVAVKDYVWEKSSNGWQTRWCPLGEGMVNWKEFFEMLVKLPFPGPLSVHIEYNPGGNTRTERIDNSLAAAQRDIQFVRKHLAEAARS